MKVQKTKDAMTRKERAAYERGVRDAAKAIRDEDRMMWRDSDVVYRILALLDQPGAGEKK